ncbi:MAG: AtpZ/AtpI family protein [Alphaproteobacteria bacterium]|nr:AtpZ/AtpI family protein [Alphaproteobacteria bacterium]
MSNGDDQKGSDHGAISAEDRASIKARADEIERRLGEARGRITPKPTVDSRQRGQAMGQGLRIAVDLVVGVAFGGFVGWWLDRYFGSAPWLMVLLIILGFTAGMMNVIRTAQRMQAEAEASQMAARSVRDRAEEDD